MRVVVGILVALTVAFAFPFPFAPEREATAAASADACVRFWGEARYGALAWIQPPRPRRELCSAAADCVVSTDVNPEEQKVAVAGKTEVIVSTRSSGLAGADVHAARDARCTMQEPHVEATRDGVRTRPARSCRARMAEVKLVKGPFAGVCVYEADCLRETFGAHGGLERVLAACTPRMRERCATAIGLNWIPQDELAEFLGAADRELGR